MCSAWGASRSTWCSGWRAGQQPIPRCGCNRWEQHLGGLTGRALEAAAKLGARCAYAGRLGTDEDSRVVAASLAAAGINTTHAVIDPAHGVVHSTIIASVGGATRNVFSNPASATGRTRHAAGPIR
jgi:sugar/nucleoside kinase (ribokinase family)